MALSGSVNTSSYDGRYYQVSWTATQSVANNQSTVSWTIKALGGESSWYAERTLKVVLGGSTVYSKTDRVQRYKGTIASGTKVINHDSSGNASFSISIQAAVYYSNVNCTGSNSFTLNNIPRKSTLSVGNGTLGTAQTLTVARNSTSFTHTITYSCGSASGTICTKSANTSISFTPPLSLAAQNTSGTSVSIKYTITTYNGSTSLGSNTYTKTCSIPSSVKPTVSFTVTDGNGYLSKYGGYIKSNSTFKVVITAAGSQGATIKSYKTTVDGKTYTAASFTSSVISGSGSLTISVTVTDSRGRTATDSKTVTVLPYTAPKINAFKVNRCNSEGIADSQGAYLKATFSASITSLSSKNSASYTLEYKKKNDSTYTQVALTDYAGKYSVTDGTYIFEADQSSSYDVRLKANDDFSNVPSTASGSATTKLFSFLARGMGIAFGKVAEFQGVFEIAFQTKFTGGILQPVLATGTDLDTVTLTNVYTGNGPSSSGYVNCPITTDTTFILEVFSAGSSGQLIQRITSCTKGTPVVYIRCYYANAWGDWITM